MRRFADKQIRSCIDWLLRNASAPVQYQTRRHLLGTSPEDEEMRRLWRQVEADRDVRRIFAGQQPDGAFFVSGPWGRIDYEKKGEKGYGFTGPKYVTSRWILIILGGMGFDRRDPRVAAACEYGMARLPPAPKTDGCSLTGFLAAMAAVGMGGDRRLAPYFKRLLAVQRDDGGWLAPGHLDGSKAPYKVWDRSCPQATHYGALALHFADPVRYREPLARALGFLARHLDGLDREKIRTWFYHGHDMVPEAAMFAAAHTGLERPGVRAVLDWLMAMYDAGEGRFVYRGKPISKFSRRKDGATPRVLKYRTYHLREPDWLTYRLTRIALSLNRSAPNQAGS